VRQTAEDLAKDAFSDPPRFFARVAEDDDGKLVGYAVYSPTYFTFTGEWIYLDDLYVRPSARSNGTGRALLAAVAEHAAERGAFGIQWTVLDWNAPAIRFYERIGATLDRSWLIEKVRGGPSEIRAFAARLKSGDR
jgi:GNAT superfamily N-acetyltransferase